MTSAALLCLGRRVVGAGFARRAEKCVRVQILEHFAHQKCAEKHDQADDDCGQYHGGSLSWFMVEGPCVTTERGKKMVKIKRFSRSMHGGGAGA